MNILFLCREYDRSLGFGGIGTYVDIISKELSKMGHRVFIISSAPRKKFKIEIKDNITIYYAKQFNLWLIEKIFWYLGFGTTYSRLMCALTNYITYQIISKKHKIDIVEIPDWYNEGLFFVIFKKIPVVCRIHGPLYFIHKYSLRSSVLRGTKYIAYKINNFLEKFTITKSNFVIVLNNTVLREIYNLFRLKRFDIISYPINIGKYNDEELKNKQFFKILFVGRIELRKNPFIIIKSIPLVIKEIKNIKFFFVGRIADVCYKNQIDKFIKEKNISEYVEFLGELNQEKIYELRKSVDISVIPSLWETFGYVVLESMVAKNPLICSDIPIFREIVKHYETGLLANPYDENEWSKYIIELIKNKELCKKLTENAKQEVIKKYSPSIIASKQIKCYENVIYENEKQKLIKKIGGFYYILPKKYNKYNIPDIWRLNILEKIDKSLTWYHFYLVTVRQILEIFYNEDLKNKKILDLGATPIVSVLLAILGAEVTMIDISDEEIEKAKNLCKKYNVENKVKIVKQDLFKINFENEFDIVFNCGVIEHFSNSVDIIKIMKRAAKVDGKVICLVPYKYTFHSLFVRQLIRKIRGYYWDRIGNIPERSYTLKRLETEFKLAGLTNIYCCAGNISRNLFDDIVIEFILKKFKLKFLKLSILKLINICDFFESKFVFLKYLGFMAIGIGTKK